MSELSAVAAEAVEIARRLIRIDTSNFGDGSGPGEREAAELVAELLTEVGYDPTIVESEDRRTTVLLRIPGSDPSAPALVVHGHTDVVPANAADWTVPPFEGVLQDGMLWGRGAVDMKDMLGMMLAVARDMKRSNWQPRRDIVLAVFADEEAGGRFGSHWVVDNHPEIFEGATDAISEVGGYSVTVNGRRVYLLQTAEKALRWMRLDAEGTAGHGSLVNHDNAITRIAGAVARIGAYDWPLHLTPTVKTLLDGVADLTGLSYDPEDRASIIPLMRALGPSSAFVEATLATGANPTMLGGGYKANVIPGGGNAAIDMRVIPGDEEAAMATIKGLAGPGIEISEINYDIGLEVPFEGDFVDAMVASITAEDPDAVVLPYMLSAGTDNKALSRLGIRGYGFTPLRLPEHLDFAGMFHGVDERVPVGAMEFGVRALENLLRTA
ncbi:Acetylornithine deacetylase/Succinyl-diaminopimelate desuccinylase [Ruaniaceae bacterium KH17]|nr:Acetylornithine deacetylase/Succinyl-diaminopimelate desuccinylase [Ruaniaceae bacterium KH17]